MRELKKKKRKEIERRCRTYIEMTDFNGGLLKSLDMEILYIFFASRTTHCTLNIADKMKKEKKGKKKYLKTTSANWNIVQCHFGRKVRFRFNYYYIFSLFFSIAVSLFILFFCWSFFQFFFFFLLFILGALRPVISHIFCVDDNEYRNMPWTWNMASNTFNE